jgi:hypothetical protein
VDLPASRGGADGDGYAFTNLDILVLHTEQEPWILGLPFFIHTRVGFFISRLALHLKQ